MCCVHVFEVLEDKGLSNSSFTDFLLKLATWKSMLWALKKSQWKDTHTQCWRCSTDARAKLQCFKCTSDTLWLDSELPLENINVTYQCLTVSLLISHNFCSFLRNWILNNNFVCSSTVLGTFSMSCPDSNIIITAGDGVSFALPPLMMSQWCLSRILCRDALAMLSRVGASAAYQLPTIFQHRNMTEIVAQVLPVPVLSYLKLIRKVDTFSPTPIPYIHPHVITEFQIWKEPWASNISGFPYAHSILWTFFSNLFYSSMALLLCLNICKHMCVILTIAEWKEGLLRYFTTHYGPFHMFAVINTF